MMRVQDYFRSVGQALAALPVEPVNRLIELLGNAQATGQRVFVFGNGGSAATASHFVTDMLKGAAFPGQPRLKISCLNDNVPMLTAYANDVGYGAVFVEPLAGLASPGDVALAISGSGNSENVLRAMAAARDLGLRRVGLTGFAGGRLKELCEIAIVVPADSMQVVEDAHLVILHAVMVSLLSAKA